jgi:hypothetical protein
MTAFGGAEKAFAEGLYTPLSGAVAPGGGAGCRKFGGAEKRLRNRTLYGWYYWSRSSAPRRSSSNSTVGSTGCH